MKLATLGALLALGPAVTAAAQHHPSTDRAAAHVANLKDGELAGPFGPTKATAECAVTGKIFFVNGRATDAKKAVEQARNTGVKLGHPVHLIYNDLTLAVIDDIALVWDKMWSADVSLNEATETLIEQVRQEIESGRQIYVVAFSGGTIVTNNALRSMADEYESLPDTERKARLGRVHVVAIADAVFDDENLLADGWPEIGSLFHVYHELDPVSGDWGPGDWGGHDLAVHDYSGRYLPELTSDMLNRDGTRVLRSTTGSAPAREPQPPARNLPPVEVTVREERDGGRSGRSPHPPFGFHVQSSGASGHWLRAPREVCWHGVPATCSSDAP